MKYLGFWMLLIPSCPPQQVLFPTPLWLPRFPPLGRHREGKIRPQTGGGSAPALWSRGWNLGLTFHIILPAHGDDTFPDVQPLEQAKGLCLGTEW